MNLSVPLPKEQKLLPVYVFFRDYNRVPLKVQYMHTHNVLVRAVYLY